MILKKARRSRPLCFSVVWFLLLLALFKWGQMTYLAQIETRENADLFADIITKKVSVQGVIEGKEISRGQLIYYLDEVTISSKDNSVSKIFSEDSYFKRNSKMICKIEETKDVADIGSSVIVTGIFMPFSDAENEGQFDENTYYGLTGYCGRLSQARVETVSGKNYTKQGQEMLLQWKWKKRIFLYRNMSRENAAVLSAMLLGDKADMDRKTKSLYQKSGIAHVLAISGFHISILGMTLYRLLRKLSIPSVVCSSAAICIVLVYAVMTGGGSAVTRASTMFILMLAADLCMRSYDMLTALAISSLVVLIKNPNDLSGAGFLLSFTAVLGIALLSPLLPKKTEKGKVKKWINSYLISPFEVSFCIQIFTLPVMLWFYYAVSPYSFLLNLIVLPLVSLLLPVSMLALVLNKAQLLLVSANLLSLMEGLCSCVQKIPYSVLVLGRPRWWQITVYYMVLSLVILFLYQQKKKKISNVRYIAVGIAFFAALVFLLLPARRDNCIDMLSVGQGDCVVLRNKVGRCMIVDAGSNSESNIGIYRLIPYLKYQGIRNVDAVFVSHAHTDHLSGVIELLQESEGEGIHIGCLVLGANAKDQGNYTQIVSAAEKAECRIVYLKKGQCVKASDLEVTCVYDAMGELCLDENDTSMVLFAKLGHMTVLLPGDSTAACDSRVLASMKKLGISQVLCLKVAHHGSSGATSDLLLDVLHPEIGLISCGFRNKYGHPHEDTIQRLSDRGCQIFVTKDVGQIRVTEKKVFSFKNGKKIRYVVK